MHRDYSIYTESIPVSIEMYRDRMVVKSSGGLFGGMPIEFLEKVRMETRNVALVNILEFLDFTGMSRYYTTSAILHPLVEQGLLLQTMPDKPKSPKQRYVKKTD